MSADEQAAALQQVRPSPRRTGALHPRARRRRPAAPRRAPPRSSAIKSTSKLSASS